MRPMSAADTATGLAGFTARGAGTDAERRAAIWLAGQVRSPRREVRLETFWCRPNWALAHAWHCLLAAVGSLVMVAHATLGGAITLVALLSVLADALTGRSLGRRLTPERASQNVVSRAPVTQAPVSVLITANYDAGRTGLAYRDGIRRPVAAFRQLAGRGALTPGWLGWLGLALLWLVAVAVLRRQGATGTAIGALQLVPTAALVVALALLLDVGLSPFGPAAGDDASGAAVAVALVRALDAAPPRNAGVELVLQGAGDGAMLGLRRHLRQHRRELRPRTTIVLGLAACGAGDPCFWMSDGPLLPLRYPARLRTAAARLGLAPHRGRGTTPALPARARGLPALTLGAVDDRGLAPRSHQPADVPSALRPATLDAVLQAALLLVDELDAELARTATGRSDAAPAAA
jgi:Peptidase family M28